MRQNTERLKEKAFLVFSQVCSVKLEKLYVEPHARRPNEFLGTFYIFVLGQCAHLKAVEYYRMSIEDKSYKGCACITVLETACMEECVKFATFGYFCPPTYADSLDNIRIQHNITMSSF
jgi:hypothetical protein